jgi:pimeloyl-ACP methyl ester carboxylesterase
MQRHVLEGEPELAYVGPDHDRGSPVLLLHGLSADTTSWTPIIDRLGDEWRMYALDFRGHGRSAHIAGAYQLDGYVDDAARMLQLIGEPTIVVGHSLGAIVATALAQDSHPLVTAVFLEDPPLYLVQPDAFSSSSFGRIFPVMRDAITRMQGQGAPVDAYRDLLAASPHPAGDKMGDHLHEDALLARAGALSQMDPDAITAAIDGTTFGEYDADRPIRCPATVVCADPAYEAAFLPEHEERLHRSSPHVDVIPMPGAAHNIRGDRATRALYLDTLEAFLRKQA